MKQIYTLCSSEEEANAIGHFILSKGYEGVQNDSYRYCDLEIESALRENRRHHRDYCFVGVDSYQMVVGKNKKEMRRKFSYKYIEKERMFRSLLDTNSIEANQVEQSCDSVATINPWHSTADGDLPPVNVDCLFVYNDTIVDKGYMSADKTIFLDAEFAPCLLSISDMQYWMEIPELPKKENTK